MEGILSQDLGSLAQNASEQELIDMCRKISAGCGNVYHLPGYMNSKGDEPYDFTCDSSHLCQACGKQYAVIRKRIKQIQQKRQQQINQNKVANKLQQVRQKYFRPKNRCLCEQRSMCKECHQFLQSEVDRLEGGCGSQWIQQFGGMAAGPGTVKCYQNIFLCSSCQEELAFINSIIKDFPEIQLKHLPQGERLYWCIPSEKPYYSEFL